MRCPKCDKFYSDMLDRCPFCHASKDFVDNRLEIKLKDGSLSKLDVDKTIAINPSMLHDTKEFTLEDEIEKQIENINEEKILDHSHQDEVVIIDDSVLQEESVLDDITSDSSISVRKRTLFIGAGIVGCLFIILAGILLLLPKKENVNYDYMNELEKGIQIYFRGEKTDRIQKVLDYVVTDSKKIDEVQKKSKELVEGYLHTYQNEDMDNSDAFLKEEERYQKFIKELYDVSSKNDNDIVRVFDVEDYNYLLKEVEHVYNEGKVYYEAIDYYHKKDYNNAYYLFGRVEEGNIYYEQAINNRNNIVTDILDILNDDIKRIELDNDGLSDEDMLTESAQIVDIIVGYDSVYNNVELKNNSTYKSLLEEYNNKVKEYSQKISNKNKVVENEEDFE
mgnify:CR=1 FL=1